MTTASCARRVRIRLSRQCLLLSLVKHVVLYVETFLLLQKTWRAHAAVAIVPSRDDLCGLTHGACRPLPRFAVIQVMLLMEILQPNFGQWKDDGMETILGCMAIMSGLSLIYRDQNK